MRGAPSQGALLIENPELLARVLAAPDDDEPRLVYADWLQENGDEDRGELIVLQCEIARALAAFRRPAASVVARERMLRTGIKATLVASAEDHVRRAWLERGFVERVWIASAGSGPALEAVCAVAPVRHVHVADAEPGWESEVADARALGPGLSLHLRGSPLDTSSLAALLAPGSSVLALHGLALHPPAGGLAEEGLACVAEAAFTGLRELEIRTRVGGGEELGRLLRAPALSGLERLSMCVAGGVGEVAAEVVAEVARAATLTGLRRFRLEADLAYGAVVGDAGIEALAAAPQLHSLVSFVATGTMLGPAGFEAVARAPFLEGLSELVLERAIATPRWAPSSRARDLLPLLASSRLGGLRHLDLSGYAVGREGATAILASPHLAGLGQLDLQGCGVPRELQAALRKRFGPGVCAFGEARGVRASFPA